MFNICSESCLYYLSAGQRLIAQALKIQASLIVWYPDYVYLCIESHTMLAHDPMMTRCPTPSERLHMPRHRWANAQPSLIHSGRACRLAAIMSLHEAH